MLVWLKNLLPRLEAYSATLDQEELIIDQPWIFLDEEGNRHQYIFMRSNELVLSRNGSVALGTWKYIPAAKSLLIDTTAEKLLLKHWFIEEGVLILKKDGNTELPFILVNERIVPDLNLESYLNSKLVNHKSTQPLIQTPTVVLASEERSQQDTNTIPPPGTDKEFAFFVKITVTIIIIFAIVVFALITKR